MRKGLFVKMAGKYNHPDGRAQFAGVVSVAEAHGMQDEFGPLFIEPLVFGEPNADGDLNPETEGWVQPNRGDLPPWWSAEDERTQGGRLP